ncbi:Uncharacterized protein APZ42_004850 [Daphnia magna]|uniref:Secreted protein n=1 Tax=Daphnia magna TaxID=35525 RepID=A0A162CUF3_9CRUS|nr:Uncharacterized protein APZ42_004850 [Daphnia magna]
MRTKVIATTFLILASLPESKADREPLTHSGCQPCKHRREKCFVQLKAKKKPTQNERLTVPPG